MSSAGSSCRPHLRLVSSQPTASASLLVVGAGPPARHLASPVRGVPTAPAPRFPDLAAPPAGSHPADAAHAAATARPPRHRQALLVFLCVTTLVHLLAPLGRLLLPSWPVALRTTLLIGLQVLLMTYVIMPLLQRRLAGWLGRS